MRSVGVRDDFARFLVREVVPNAETEAAWAKRKSRSLAILILDLHPRIHRLVDGGIDDVQGSASFPRLRNGFHLGQPFTHLRPRPILLSSAVVVSNGLLDSGVSGEAVRIRCAKERTRETRRIKRVER